MLTRKDVLNEVKRLVEIGNKSFPTAKLNFDKIETRFTLRGKTAGKACYDGDNNVKLWFHPQLMQRCPQDYMSTISHEVAHLFQRKLYPTSKPHGREFKRVARMLGNNGTRCHSMDTKGIGREKKRFVYHCPKKCYPEYLLTEYKHNIQQNIRQPRRYTCKHCGSILVWGGVQVVVK